MSVRNGILPIGLLTGVFLLFTSRRPAWAKGPVNTNFWGVAIKGYDTGPE